MGRAKAEWLQKLAYESKHYIWYLEGWYHGFGWTIPIIDLE